MTARLRVLTQMPVESVAPLCEGLPVEWLRVPTQGPPPPEAAGEVLLTFAWGSPNLPQLVERGVRWIHTVGTGVDRFPFEAVGDRTLTCARGATAGPIAEWVLAMLLCHEKQLPAAWLHAPPAPPERWNLRELGTLEGRTLGLVGFGAIAREVVARARPFGMQMRAVRRTAAPSDVPDVAIDTDLRALASRSDHLVVAASATNRTRHLIDADVLAAVKPGLHLVNVARGSLVDQDALREALRPEGVALASLDTVEPEPLPAGHWLFTHPRVRLSAHVSWNAPGALQAILATFAANLRRYLAGEPLEGVVDLERGY